MIYESVVIAVLLGSVDFCEVKLEIKILRFYELGKFVSYREREERI